MMNSLRPITVLASIGLVISVFACGRGDKGVTVNRAAAPQIKNVIFIILDALRADHLGCYGYQRDTSPNIDRLAEKGLLFERAIVTGGWTKPSIPSYFTSTYPSVHRVTEQENVLPKNIPTMAEIFRANDFFSCGFYRNHQIAPEFGFSRGFDYYRDTRDPEIKKRALFALTRGYARASQLTDSGDGIFDRFMEEVRDSNLVNDGGFEGTGKDWRGAKRLCTDMVSHTGDNSVYINQERYPKKGTLPLKQVVSVKSGTDYIFGAFIKTRDLHNKVRVQIKDLDSGKSFVSDVIEGDNDWTLLVGIFRAPPEEDGKSRVEFEIRPGLMYKYRTGEFWIDDVFIIPFQRLTLPDLPRKKFFYLHFLDPHYPYEPPPEYLDCFRGSGEVSPEDKYDGEIKAQDARLGRFFQELERAGVLNDTLVVITSDHGEAFGRHDIWRHAPGYFWEGVARVPLIFYCPGLFPEPGRVKGTVQAGVNLLPSLVDLLGLTLPPGIEFQGESYFQDNRTGPRYAFFYDGPFVRMVTGDGWKYVTSVCHGFYRKTAVRGQPAENGGVLIELAPAEGESSGVFIDLNDLRSSGLMKNAAAGLREEIEAVFTAVRDWKELLFNLKDDPGENINLVDRSPDVARRFRAIIRDRVAADRAFQERSGVIPGGKTELTETMKKQLRALGYAN